MHSNFLSSLFELINPDNTMTINRKMAHRIGLNETILYFALISKYTYYANNNMLTEDGDFFSTAEDLFESTTLTRRQQDSAFKRLKEYGLVRIQLKGLPAKRYFMSCLP